MIKLARFVAVYLRFNLASAMEYRVPFLSQVIGMAINDGIMIFFWWVFFQRFPQVSDWTLADVLRLWGVGALAFGLATGIFGNAPRLASLILNGQLDYYLALPKDTLLHVLVSRTGTAAWGDALFGLLAFVLAGDLTLASVALFAILTVSSCVIFISYPVLVGSLAFWLGNVEVLSAQASATLVHFATYPGSIFRGWVKLLAFTVIPAAMVGHLPVTLLRRFEPPVFAGVLLFALGSAILAIAVFRLGLRRYEAGSLVSPRI